MIVQLPFPATLDDLMKVDGKAELIGGRIVEQMATGDLPHAIGLEITFSLREYARRIGRGRAYADNAGFALSVPLISGRESFSPDAAFLHDPPKTNRMKFIPGVPGFAVEVRSENDYGRTAERALADKRADYFEAGTLVVWDVDPIACTITKYMAIAAPTLFRAGDIADAEPALPGWRLTVDEIFNV